MRTNCLLSDCKTGEILIGASSVCVMMNKLTRKLSKIPEEVRKEMEAYSANSALILEEDNNQLPKLDDNSADYISTSFSPKWSDLDVNQHVNNVKYIDWILESVPVSIMESHELSSMTLEYRRECGKNDKLQSLIAVSGPVEVANLRHGGHVECNHLLRLEDGAEIMRGRTEWRPKLVNKFDIMHKVL
ncbi:hypothetical protein RIF29_09318 [Crotalaria pallida]|uniref:Acyl-ACP thioesterase-like C-terminal domain-containing protein n=1 Tax=Crotalaria pallida TaxID=3830 RepID=A0AAN9FRQ2_CROPI